MGKGQLIIAALGWIAFLVSIVMHSFQVKVWITAVPEAISFHLLSPTDSMELIQIEKGPRIINEPGCGLASKARLWPEEVVEDKLGGVAAGFGTFPWQVRIGVGEEPINCGGVIINERHVVTAASCVAKYTAYPTGTAIRVGDYVIPYRDEEPAQYKSFYISPYKIILHPLYKESSHGPDPFNVAVLKLKYKLKYQPHIRPICLPEKGENYSTGQMAWNSGWGDVEPVRKGEVGDGSTKSWRRTWLKLYAVEMPIVDSDHCRKRREREGQPSSLSEDMLCAGLETFNEKRQCQGERGGPLMLQRDDGRWYLIGVQSERFACSYVPGTYHRVSSTSDWISKVANEDEEEEDENDVV